MEREAPATTSDDELQRLRVGLRDRHSVDHLARAWTSTLISILLAGVWIKLRQDSLDRPLLLWSAGLLCLAVLANAANQARLGLRLLRQERASLARVRDLETRSPAPPELF
jgi:hypothetical protein